jgi:hypothetical protein
MTTAEHPITRSELREELARYPTKAELREELSHYATKADLAELKADLHQSMHQMESRLLRWMAGWTTGGMVAITGLVLAVVRLAGN